MASSYVTEDKVYCLYLAPDEDSIREHARKAGVPADRVGRVYYSFSTLLCTPCSRSQEVAYAWAPKLASRVFGK